MSHTSENTENNSVVPPLNINTIQSSIICKCWEDNFVIDIILLLIFVLIVYYILAIFILVQDYNNANECKDSYLWIYILTSVIIGLLKSCLISIYKNKDNFLEDINIYFKENAKLFEDDALVSHEVVRKRFGVYNKL